MRLFSMLGGLTLCVLSACEVGDANEVPPDESPYFESGPYTCFVWGTNHADEALGWTGVASFDDCHDFTYEVGDAYCNDRRAGRLEGPNPVNLNYVLQQGWPYPEGDWLFQCEE